MKRVMLITLLAGCVYAPSEDSQDHAHHDALFVKQALEHSVAFEQPVRQVGLMFDADSTLYYQTDIDADWEEVPVTWSEDRAKVGVILLDGDASEITLRSDSPFENATIQLYEEQTARDFSYDSEEETRTATQALAPADLVVSRSNWGARNPSKVCGSAHTPTYMSIHHTALPDSDGGDPAARMRQMQAFHIDSRGWCDIGYHFVVSQSGVIFQGRSNEQRSGAHVGGANTNNVGISLIGDYEANQPGETQIEATQKIMNWVGETYDIPFTRDRIKGHTEWPGQTTNCPGRNVLAMFDDLIAGAETPGASSPCEEVAAGGGIIDDTSACFKSFGPSQYWRRVSGAGFNGGLLWTNAWRSATPTNYARWTVNVAAPGRYKVEYYSEPDYALFNAARFAVAASNSQESITVDLRAGVKGWNELGTFEFSGGAEWVEVYDNASFSVASGQRIPADAIRLTPVDAPVVEGNPSDPLPVTGGVIDNDSECFEALGPSRFWRIENEGFGGSLLWTSAWRSNLPSNFAVWDINVSAPGTYRVEYHSVSEFATFDSTRFGVKHQNQTAEVTVDLSAGVDGWNELGVFDFDGSDEAVTMYDNVSFSVPSNQRVIADAIRVVPFNTQVLSPGQLGIDDTTTDSEADSKPTVNPEADVEGDSSTSINGTSGCSSTETSGSWLALFALFVFGFRRRRVS